MYKIYYVEDDQALQNQIKSYLESFNFHVDVVNDFKNIKSEFENLQADLVIMDINLPYFDGYYFCKSIRKISKVPIIFASARREDFEQIMAMELGADDYITKPFNLQLMISRINALLRRTYGDYAGLSDDLSVKGLVLDDKTYKLSYAGSSIELSKNEYKLMRAFLQAPNEIISRDQMLTILWDDDSFVDYNTLTVNVTRVKNKLKVLGLTDLIQNKRGVGYVFKMYD